MFATGQHNAKSLVTKVGIPRTQESTLAVLLCVTKFNNVYRLAKHLMRCEQGKKEVVLGLGELIVRERNNNKWKRRLSTDITVFDSTGVAVQDVSIASLTLSLLKKSSRAGNGGNGGLSKL